MMKLAKFKLYVPNAEGYIQNCNKDIYINIETISNICENPADNTTRIGLICGNVIYVENKLEDIICEMRGFNL